MLLNNRKKYLKDYYLKNQENIKINNRRRYWNIQLNNIKPNHKKDHHIIIFNKNEYIINFD